MEMSRRLLLLPKLLGLLWYMLVSASPEVIFLESLTSLSIRKLAIYARYAILGKFLFTLPVKVVDKSLSHK